MKTRIRAALLIAALSVVAHADPVGQPPASPPTLRNVNGQKEGVEVKHHDNGAVRETISWKAGKRHGPYRSYHKNGKVNVEVEYADGLRQGLLREFNSSGEIVWEKPYKDGKLHGTRNQWCNDSDEKNNPQPLFARTQFEEGVEHGEYVEYWSNGKVNVQGQYQFGLREGVWNFYASSGKRLNTVTYSKGKKVTEIKGE